MKLDPQEVKPLEPSDYRIDLSAIPAEEIERLESMSPEEFDKWKAERLACARDPEFAAAATAHDAPAVESVESIVGANNDWLSVDELMKLESFRKLSPNAALLLLEYRKTGSQLQAVRNVTGLTGEPARLAAFQFDKGSLSEAVSDMKKVSAQDRLLAEATKLVRSKKTTANQVNALKLLVELTGLAKAGSAVGRREIVSPDEKDESRE